MQVCVSVQCGWLVSVAHSSPHYESVFAPGMSNWVRGLSISAPQLTSDNQCVKRTVQCLPQGVQTL